MKETGFIKQNKEKWIEFEKILQLKKKDPDKLSSLFIQITDDLSYSRTFYPNRSVRVYLNNIAQQVFQTLYKNKRERGKRFITFWKSELPELVYDARPELRLSLLVFVVSMAIGILSCHNDPDFMRFILGDSYVEMTKANIESGDPMAVYKSMHQVDMFFFIAFNNLRVAFMTFLLGILCGVGTMGIMVFNGIMVGVFQYFFIQRGLYMESFLAVWLHGTIEISSIIIAGGAGLTLGKGLVFPGTYSRIESFQVTAKRGLMMMIGIAPLIIFAAIIESFLTRYTAGTGIDIVRGVIILFSLVFILGYFIWYPIVKVEKNPRRATVLTLSFFFMLAGFILYPLFHEQFGTMYAIPLTCLFIVPAAAGLWVSMLKMGRPTEARKDPLANAKLPPTIDQSIDTDMIKSNGEIFSDTFVFLRKHARKIVMTSAGLAVAYTVIFVIFYAGDFTYSFDFTNENFLYSLYNAFIYLGDLAQYFSYSDYPELMIGNVIIFSVMSALAVHLWVLTSQKKKLPFKASVINFMKSVLIIGITSLITWVHPLLFFLLLLAVFPILMFWLFITQVDNTNIFTSFGRSFTMMGGRYFSLVGLNLIFVVVSIIFLFLVSSPIVWVMVKTINMGIDLAPDAYWLVMKAMLTFTSFAALGILFVMTFSGSALFYYSSREAIEAASLKQRIMSLRTKHTRRTVTHEI